MPVDAHLQMIQAIIARLGSQSTTVKGWCVTVTAALLGFGTSRSSSLFAAVAMYVVFAFAVLDAYYLSLERAYRSLYDRVVDGQATDWRLKIEQPGLREVGSALASPSVGILYGASMLTVLAVGGYLVLR
jgi:hypothetical protein